MDVRITKREKFSRLMQILRDTSETFGYLYDIDKQKQIKMVLNMDDRYIYLKKLYFERLNDIHDHKKRNDLVYDDAISVAITLIQEIYVNIVGFPFKYGIW